MGGVGGGKGERGRSGGVKGKRGGGGGTPLTHSHGCSINTRGEGLGGGGGE